MEGGLALKFKKTLLTCCSLALMCTLILPHLLLSPRAAGALSDETDRQVEELLLPDGRHTGVAYTQIRLDGAVYGNNRVVNVAEFDLSNTHLSFEVLMGGDDITDMAVMTDIADAYTAANPQKTLLAAINGDLWMTSVHSNANVTRQVLTVPRGVLIKNGEILCSQQIDQENKEASNAEKGQPAGDKCAFGTTWDNQPLFGSPQVKLTLSAGGRSIEAHGLNRLPAMDALIVYNHRMTDSNYALDDAYEIELTVADSAAIRPGGSISATVTAIYPANSPTRPAIGEKTVLLTARGSSVATLETLGLQVGHTLTISAALSDRMGNTALWQSIRDAIGGHMQPIVNGGAVSNPDTTAYPTTIIGYKADGNVVFTTVTSGEENSRAGLRFSDAYRFCQELGLNTAFYLDGGGSTTFLTLEAGSYRVRNHCSDGAQRAVINGVGVVWNETPICQKQGSLYHIRIPTDLKALTPTYLDGTLLYQLFQNPNQMDLSYNAAENGLDMKISKNSGDPYVTFNLTSLSDISADSHRYVVLKYKTDASSSSFPMAVYYALGSNPGHGEDRVITATGKKSSSAWQYVTLDLGSKSNWTGALNNIRLDPINGAPITKDCTFTLGAVLFCNSLDQVSGFTAGTWLPAGAAENYRVYLESLQPFPDPSVTLPATTVKTTATKATTAATKATTVTTKATTVTGGTTATATAAPASPTGTATPATVPSSPSGTAADTGGCGSSIAASAVLCTTLLCLGISLVRKKKK